MFLKIWRIWPPPARWPDCRERPCMILVSATIRTLPGNTPEQKEREWEFVVKMTIIIRDIMLGDPKLKELGYYEESLGRNVVASSFQG